MQTRNSAHTPNAWVENIRLCSSEKDLVTQAPFSMLSYCCIISRTVMFFVSRTTLNALNDKRNAGLMLKVVSRSVEFVMYVYFCESLDSSTVTPPLPPVDRRVSSPFVSQCLRLIHYSYNLSTCCEIRLVWWCYFHGVMDVFMWNLVIMWKEEEIWLYICIQNKWDQVMFHIRTPTGWC